MGSDQSTPSGGGAASPGGSGSGYRLLLHVYEPAEQQGVSMPGFGVYHSGLEVMGMEYTFAGGPGQAGSGVMSHRPKSAPPGSPWKYKQTEDLGPLKLDRAAVTSILDRLKQDFPAKDYDVMAKNCNHFTEAFATSLGANFPAYVNRAAKVGNNFRGLMGQPAAPGAPAKPVEPAKSVFQTSKGYSLTDTNTKQPSQTNVNPATGKQERHNPWRDPNFVPGKQNKPQAAAAK